ncbi:hypothetical protein [Hymenobacter metallilatus]|uniref:Uncharacterized protein n=1 Tax=Hymenobacter metallilatus TaxID=2493666 RepID=A0A428JCR4_9BACT|nr:hypothetical protein [Hymenobacter metallilatus]RSK29915.1 hypothetical protein EI290_16400 [Hymenobacter metallilatus]
MAWLLFTPIGALYLLIRYRGSAKRQQVLAQEYENEYANVGHVMVMNTVAAVLIVVVLGMLLMVPICVWRQV